MECDLLEEAHKESQGIQSSIRLDGCRAYSGDTPPALELWDAY